MKIAVKAITAFRVVCPYCKISNIFTSKEEIDKWISEHVHNEVFGCSANPKTKKCASCANAIPGGKCRVNVHMVAFVNSVYGDCPDWVCKKSLLKYVKEDEE